MGVNRKFRWLLAAGGLLLMAMPGFAGEAKHGGIWRIYHRDSPASASIHEEATYSTNIPFMPVFNNLVLYRQDEPRNSFETIVPDLATGWTWGKDGTELTFKLREGVKWHDGKPFASKDVKCTFDMLMGKSTAKFRKNPRQNWYENVTEVTTNGDYEASFHLKRAQPALLALLASGYTPVYPCHVSPADMRARPIGTGPFKFVEFKPNESIKLTKNPDYWKKDRPYLDGIEFTIVSNRGDDSAAQGRAVAGAQGGLRARADQRQHQPDRQPRGAAVRQCRAAARDGVGAGPQGLHRYSVRGQERHRRLDAAAAGRHLGHAAGDLEDHSRLRPRRAEESRRSPEHHGEARLRARQEAQDQGLDPQHRALSRSRRDPHRSAQGDLYRR